MIEQAWSNISILTLIRTKALKEKTPSMTTMISLTMGYAGIQGMHQSLILT